jgi:hypothetical protein
MLNMEEESKRHSNQARRKTIQLKEQPNPYDYAQLQGLVGKGYQAEPYSLPQIQTAGKSNKEQQLQIGQELSRMPLNMNQT